VGVIAAQKIVGRLWTENEVRATKRAQRKTDKAVAGLKDFLISMGQDPDAVNKAFDDAPMHNDENMLQAEGVLLHLLKPTRFMSKKCKRPECGETFGTSYRAVAYCSDNCRARHLESQTGIRWNPHTDRYRNLDGERPLVIGPKAYAVLVEFAQHILAQNGIVVDPQKDQTQQVQIDQTLEPQPEPQSPELTGEYGLFQLVSLPEPAQHTSPDVLPQQSEPTSPLDPTDPFGF
jgi:hypothetical protein